jgi:hypothetical protein
MARDRTPHDDNPRRRRAWPDPDGTIARIRRSSETGFTTAELSPEERDLLQVRRADEWNELSATVKNRRIATVCGNWGWWEYNDPMFEPRPYTRHTSST